MFPQEPESTTLTVSVHLNELHPKQESISESKAKRKIVKAGRRGGKTTLAADLTVNAFLDGKRVLYAVPTSDQLTKWWFEVKQALKPALDAGVFKVNETNRTIERTGTENRIRGKTAWNAQTLRGDFADLLILDEVQNMTEDVWNEVGAPMLLDNDGDAIFIFTPPSLKNRAKTGKNRMWVIDFMKSHENDPTGRWEIFSFTSHDNPYISENALQDITGDMTALAYRQEIMAEAVMEAPGALWTREIIERNRRKPENAPKPEEYDFIVVGVDPAATSYGDETGIVVCGKKGLEYYILEDASLNGSPETWASAAGFMFEKWQANYIVAESNQGGEMVMSVLKQANQQLPVLLVHASRGKHTRAEPISLLYAKNVVHHVGDFKDLKDLEDEMCMWIPGEPSPDHMDAMVWGMTYLLTGGMPQVY